MHDGSIMITGGKDPTNARARRDAFQVFPNSGVILRKGSMLEGRVSHCLVYRFGCVYALGGLPSLNSCERFALDKNS